MKPPRQVGNREIYPSSMAALCRPDCNVDAPSVLQNVGSSALHHVLTQAPIPVRDSGEPPFAFLAQISTDADGEGYFVVAMNWNGGFGMHSGPSSSDLLRSAIRPLRTLNVDPMNGRLGRESGLRPKECIAPIAETVSETSAQSPHRPPAETRTYRLPALPGWKT